MENNLVRQLDSQINFSRTAKKYSAGKIVVRILLGLFILLVFISVALFFALYLPAKKIVSDVRIMETTGNGIVSSLKKQDLGAVNTGITVLKNDLETLKKDTKRLSWTSKIPILKNYYADGQSGLIAAEELILAGQSAIEAVTPYADFLGLKGLNSTADGGKTAQDRINFIINTIDKIKPQLSVIGQHLESAKNAVDRIDSARYPKNIRGIALRSKIDEGKNLLDEASILVNEARPFLEASPHILGIDSPRKYLVMFQNDAELRPTGGFMTAYAILQVDKGKISTLQSDDIYALDAKFTKKIPAPPPIVKYLPKVPNWYLRDQNLSPDFKVSMDTFYPNYLTTGMPKVDGIIAMDTQVLVNLLKVTGKIGVSGFGNYSADIDPRCNCPQVFYELELYADVEGPVVWDSVSGQIIVQPKNYGERKAFIGPIMYSVLSNVMAQPKSKMGELFTTVMNLTQAKHIQFYFIDPKIQAAAESFNLAGRLRESPSDYLFVVDTNFAGAKTNAWVTYTADQKIDISSDGKAVNTLTLKYNNPQPYFEDKQTKLKLNGLFRDWLRVYVPKGSKLLEAKGFETGQITYDELGKTVFEGFFTLTPLNVKTITLKYELPVKISSPYSLLIQKQGGSKDFPYNLTVNGKKQPELILTSDKSLNISF